MRKLTILGIILALFSACSGGGGGNDNNDETCPILISSSEHHESFATRMEDGVVMVTTVDFGPNADAEAIRSAVNPPHCPVPTAPTSPITDVVNCFNFIDTSVPVWRSVENIIVDPTNDEGMNEDEVVALYASAVATWESEVGTNIFGNVSRDDVSFLARATIGKLANGKNEVVFDDVEFNGALATTFTFYRDGNMVEADVVFNQEDYDWSTDATGSITVLDFHNVATHEGGHTIGLGHPDPSSAICSDQTMWFTALFGETKKRDLGEGDVSGAQLIYSAPGAVAGQ